MIDKRYRLDGMIGIGGMSIVYRAVDKEKDKEVAIKFLKKGITTYIDDVIRFKREIEAVSKLKHPNIIRLYGSGECNYIPYIVMEILDGENLDDLLNKGKIFNERETVTIIKQIAEALYYVHGHGIIHRDIKPDNIMVIKEKDHYSVKLLDFGISRILKPRHFIDDDEPYGTYGFMSPEAIGIINKQVDERSDLYSLGVNFYLMLTGSFPIADKRTKRLLQKMVSVVPARPSKVKINISKDLDGVVLKLLEKEPSLRYQSAKGLIFDLEQYEKGERKFIIGSKDQQVKLSYQIRLIDREKELHKIKELFNKVKFSQGSVCLISGEPGIGKSRLAEEIREYTYEQGGMFIWGRCFDQENKIPYQAFRDALDSYLRYIERLDKTDKEAEIKRAKEIVGELGEIIIRLNTNMKQVLGEVSKLVPLDPERENQRFLMVASNFFCNLGTKEQACVMFLDDLQWADEGTLRLLEEISGTIEEHNVLIIGTFRDNEVGPAHSLTRVIEVGMQKEYPIEVIKLSFFDFEQMNQIVAEILGEKENETKKVAEYVMDKSDGNTFFGIEVMRELVVEQGLLWKEGNWEEDWQKIKKMHVSDNMIDLIVKRIEKLPKNVIHMLCIGSVIGREFEIDMICRLLTVDNETAVWWIDESIESQLLEMSREKGKVLFVHDRIRDAFYNRLIEEQRKNTHLDVARTLENKYKDNLDAVLFDLIHHYAEGGNDEKTLQYALPSAEKAKQNYANEEAIRYYKLAIQLLEEKGMNKSDDWIKAKEGLIEVYLTVGNNDEAIQICEEILSYKKENLDKAKIYGKIGHAYFKRGNYEQGEANFSRGLYLLGVRIPLTKREVYIDIIKGLFVHILHCLFPKFFYHKESKTIKPENREKIEIYSKLVLMYGFCDMNKCFSNILSMLNLSESYIGLSKELGIALSSYGTICSVLSFFKRGIKYLERGLEVNKSVNDQWNIAFSLKFISLYYYLIGKYNKSIETISESVKMFNNMGDMWEIAIDLNIRGHTQRYFALYNESINSFLEYLEISQKIKDDYGISSAMSYLALAHIERGDFDKAEEWNKKSLSISESQNILYNVCFGNIHMGYLYIEKSEFQKAINYLEKARKLYEENKFLKDWTTMLYHHLADAYIEDYKLKNKKLSNEENKKYIKKIKYSCNSALKLIKPCVNHYGAALRVMAKYYVLVNNQRRAKEFFKKSIEQLQSIERWYELGRSYYEYGNFLESTYRKKDSINAHKEAFDIFKKIGAKTLYAKIAEKI